MYVTAFLGRCIPCYGPGVFMQIKYDISLKVFALEEATQKTFEYYRQ